MYGKIFSEMGMMAFTMAAGYLLRRRELITEAGKKSLTNLILYFILPCNIIKAFCIPFSRQLLVQMSMALFAAVLVQVISMLLAAAAYRRLPKGERQVFQYGTVCSNAGFIGNAVAQGVYGDTGLLIASIYLIPLRIVMWTAGISYFTEGGSVWKSMKKVLLHPCMIAVYIGMGSDLFCRDQAGCDSGADVGYVPGDPCGQCHHRCLHAAGGDAGGQYDLHSRGAVRR